MTDFNVADLKGFITFRLARLQSRLNVQAIRLLRTHSDLTLTEWRVLALVAVMDDCNLSDLVRETDLDKGQLSRGVTSLVNKKYLTSKVNKSDQRQNFLHLTDQGDALHATVLPIMRRRQSDLTKGISQEDLAAALRVVDHLHDVSAPLPEDENGNR
ncbi:MAG: MarR family winged helix-turn-helix transcriptional regulator [Aliishimia sp.]